MGSWRGKDQHDQAKIGSHVSTNGRNAMAGPLGKVGYKLVGIAFAVPTGIIIKKGVDAVWRRARGTEPPRNAKAPENDWADVLLWAAASGTAVALGQVIASRGAEKTYRAITGLEAPPVEKSKAKTA
jgi:Protein of unknown function (DUF4235)